VEVALSAPRRFTDYTPASPCNLCGKREPNDGYREFARAEYGVDLRPGTLDDEAASDETEPSAHARVVQANRRRTLRRYLLSGSTWANAAGRLWARAQEKHAVRAGLSGRATLDALYEEEAPQTSRGAL
jgi:hypothetical protein